MSTAYLNSEFTANMVALRTIVYREIRRFTRIWPQTLLPPAITMVLYFVIFGNLIGSRSATWVASLIWSTSCRG